MEAPHNPFVWWRFQGLLHVCAMNCASLPGEVGHGALLLARSFGTSVAFQSQHKPEGVMTLASDEQPAQEVVVPALPANPYNLPKVDVAFLDSSQRSADGLQSTIRTVVPADTIKPE